MGIAVVVVIAAVVLVATGRGGGLSVERSDYEELDLGPLSATDVALLRPPTALWGYNMQATDEAMELIAESLRERDVRIVALEQLVTDLSREPVAPLGSPYMTARHRREPLDHAPTAESPPAEAPRIPAAEAPWAPPAVAPRIPAAEAPWAPPAEAPWTPPAEAPRIPAAEAPWAPPAEAPRTPAAEAPWAGESRTVAGNGPSELPELSGPSGPSESSGPPEQSHD